MRASPCPAPSASSHPRDNAVTPPAAGGTGEEGMGKEPCGAALESKTWGMQEGWRQKCVEFIGFGCVLLGMKPQVEPYLAGVLEMCVPSRDSKQLLTAVLPRPQPSEMGLEFSWARKDPQRSGLCHSLRPPEFVNPLGMGLESSWARKNPQGSGMCSSLSPPAQPEEMFGFTPSRFYTNTAFSHKGKSSKDQRQNKRKTKGSGWSPKGLDVKRCISWANVPMKSCPGCALG